MKVAIRSRLSTARRLARQKATHPLQLAAAALHALQEKSVPFESAEESAAVAEKQVREYAELAGERQFAALAGGFPYNQSGARPDLMSVALPGVSWFGRGPARAATPFKFFEERQASHDEHIVQRILRDKPSQLAIGLFVATFVHAILALREVTINGDSTGNVPGVAVVTAFTPRSRQHRRPRDLRPPHRPGPPRLSADRTRR